MLYRYGGKSVSVFSYKIIELLYYLSLVDNNIVKPSILLGVMSILDTVTGLRDHENDRSVFDKTDDKEQLGEFEGIDDFQDDMKESNLYRLRRFFFLYILKKGF